MFMPSIVLHWKDLALLIQIRAMLNKPLLIG